MKIGVDAHVCIKRKKEDSAIIYKVAVEDYYEKLLEAHIQTGHGGRDRMFYFANSKWAIPRRACAIFSSLCTTCDRKKGFAKKGVVVKPITTNGFNVRCQIDLVDFQSCPDGISKFFLLILIFGGKFYHDYYLLLK